MADMTLREVREELANLPEVRYRVVDRYEDERRYLSTAQHALEENATLRAEGRGLIEALKLSTTWCRYRRTAIYDECEDNCSKAHRYQEGCPVYLPTVEPSLTTADAEKWAAMERVVEVMTRMRPYFGTIGVPIEVLADAEDALAAFKSTEVSNA